VNGPGLGRAASRLARDDEVATWREDGWVLLEGLIAADEIDAAVADLELVFPSAAEYHRDPAAGPRTVARPPARAP